VDKQYNILICPLEWGLGHAARMIPVARMLQEMNNRIFIGCGDEHFSLISNELHGLTFIRFPGFKPGYSRRVPQYIILLFKLPILLCHIVLEHYRLKKIIRDYAIDIVISDNRFGLWNRDTTTAYFTHMPRIPFPKAMRWLEFIGVRLHRAAIEKFSLCFIPDLPGEINVSGRLSHGIDLPGNARFTGILSRFATQGVSSGENLFNFSHSTVILSGPEPQKGILKEKLSGWLKDLDHTVIMLEGKPAKKGPAEKHGNIVYYSHLPGPEMKLLIEGSDYIFCRSGYTTIMELISLKRSALLIPTPGQTEQEYLADYLSGKGWFNTVSQENIKGGILIHTGRPGWPDEILTRSEVLLRRALNELMEKHHKKC
jgi:hypothetical protein